MARINYAGSGHGRLAALDPDGEIRFWEYDDPVLQIKLHAAFMLIHLRSSFSKRCNACFKRLPGKRSFDEVWKDDTIWISYDPQPRRGWYGAAHPNNKDITLSARAFAKGPEWVAGTLVHELAHTNGAPAENASADETLLECDFKAVYEGVIGHRRRQLPTRLA